MTKASNRAARATAGAVSIIVLLSAAASLAAGSSRQTDTKDSPAGPFLVQAAPAPMAPGVSNPAPATAGQQPQRSANAPAQQPGGPAERVEARISELHAKLHITPAQESQFRAYADVMRSNAQSMQNLLQQQPQNTGMTAVDVLRSYERLTTTHAEALNKLVPVFEALYATLSDEQKKAADAIFRPIAQRRAPRKAG